MIHIGQCSVLDCHDEAVGAVSALSDDHGYKDMFGNPVVIKTLMCTRHQHAVTVVSTPSAFVDTADDAAQIIGRSPSGAAVPIGTDLPDTALTADRDTQGRLPVVVPGPNRLLLVDSAGIPVGRAGGAPIAVDLGEGIFSSPVASDGVIAVVEQTHNRLLVFAVDGRSLGVTDLPPGSGPASITRGGDGRIHVDDADGAATHVVGTDGEVTPVATGGAVDAVSPPPEPLHGRRHRLVQNLRSTRSGVNSEPARVRRLPTVLLSVGVVATVVVAMMIVSGAASPAMALQATGHWVFNRSESSVVHVDSGTRQVDARVRVPAAGTDPLFAMEGDRQGFLVGRNAITVFGKSTLTVDATVPTGQSEMPVGIEVVGGPYLVYQQAGTIVRLGVPPLSIPIGGPVGRPVYTDDGTVWLHRPDNGALCALRRGADTLDCSLQTAAGVPGALTVASATPGFLDTAQDAVQGIETAALRAPVSVGADLPDPALIGDRDTQGRLPVVVTAPNRLVLADTSGVPAGRAGGSPIPVDLGEGQFTSPVAADGVVAVIEQTHNRLLTYGIDGHQLGAFDLPPGGGPASISRGEGGRIYVDDADGAATHLVGANGQVTSIKTGGIMNAVVAAPPNLASLVRPPRRDPSTGPMTNQPGQLPVKLPDPSTGNNPVDPLPTAPTGVTAVATPDGAVTVTWNAVAGSVQYSVLVDGAEAARSSGTTASLPGLTVGQTYLVTVAAINATGPGPESPCVTVTPFRSAAAPLNARISIHEAGDRTQISLFWDAPDLGGGDLVGYEVTGPGGQAGPIDQIVTQQGTSTLQFNEFNTNQYCSSTIQYEVRAITTPPGGGPQSKGAVAAASHPSIGTCGTDPVGPPGAPTGLTIAQKGQGARSTVLELTWQRPALNGGELVNYVVVASNKAGEQVLDTTSTTESIPAFQGDVCLAPYRFTVQAVTRTPGTTATMTGPAAVASSAPYDCTWDLAITAQATGPQSASVAITQTNGVFPYASGPCSVLFNGATQWTGTCGGTKTPRAPISIAGLTAATDYQVVVQTTQVDGSVTSSNTVSLTTPA